jgi:hypothetical protein
MNFNSGLDAMDDVSNAVNSGISLGFTLKKSVQLMFQRGRRLFATMAIVDGLGT